jgi:hypothetical protein
MDKEHFKGGWLRQQPDHRDYKFEDLTLKKAVKLPTTVDLRSQILSVNDQDGIGCCVSEGVTKLFESCQVRLTGKEFEGCIKYEYRNARILSGTFPGDNGADVRAGVKATDQYGMCHESLWPFDTNIDAAPPASCATDAVKNKATNYYALDSTAGSAQTLLNIKTALASGFCVTFGTTVYDSIFNVSGGSANALPIIPYPSGNDPVAGGHCMLFCGYDASNLWLVNSWNTNWGFEGFARLPNAYITNAIASDFWTIIAESEIGPTPPPVSTVTPASVISVVNI